MSRWAGRWPAIFAVAGSAGAAAVSVVILVQTSRPDAHIRGCGGGGCASAWASKWSTLFGLPVAAGALVVYLAIFGFVCLRPKQTASRWAVIRANGLLGAGVIALLSILYFAGIQAFVLKELCRWCLGAHLLGLIAIAGVFLLRPWSAANTQGWSGRPRPVVSPVVGAAIFAGFAGLQSVDPGPETHKIVELPAPDGPGLADAGHAGPDPKALQLQSHPDTLLLPTGARVERGQFPTIGPADADQVVFKLFDYTCDTCREVHGHIEKVWPALEGEPALVLVPCPLNRACHPTFPSSIANHPYACELSQLGMAVWFADPARFHDYHCWAFATKPRPDAAKAYAAGLVGEAELEAALQDPRIDANIAIAAELFASAGGIRMPKLYLPTGRVVVGTTRNSRELRGIFEGALR